MTTTEALPLGIAQAKKLLAKELAEQLEQLQKTTARGGYDAMDLDELATILRDIRLNISGNDTVIAEAAGISPSTVRATYEGQNRPRYVNFMRLVSGALSICRKAEVSDDAGSFPLLGKLPSQSHISDWKIVSFKVAHRKISELVRQLDEVLTLTRGCNDGGQLGLTEIQKSQLIAMLETALALLKSPMVEIGLFRRIGSWLKSIVGRAATEQAESAIGLSVEKAGHLLGDFINSL